MVAWKAIELHNIVRLRPQIEGAIRRVQILGYNEDNWVIFFLFVDASVYTVQLM
jgi:hypothetical protein